MATVDVVVPCYNYARYLRECVQSVLDQQGVAVRVLIIDDASPDDTEQVGRALAAADSRVEFRRHAANRGHIATYNEGIDWASADYMLLLSADDYLLPGALKRSVEIFAAHPEAGLVFGKGIVLAPSGFQPPLPGALEASGCAGYRVLAGRDFILLSGACNIVCTPTAVVRTELQKRLGGYRPELPHSGDMEMWLRFAARAPVGISEAYHAVYRRHSRNMSDGYAGPGWLPDLEQRKAAFDSFFQESGHLLPDLGPLRRRLTGLLARDAVRCASMAYNAQNLDDCAALRQFARRIDPGVHWSWPWAKLACKRLIGHQAWNALQPRAAKLRR